MKKEIEELLKTAPEAMTYEILKELEEADKASIIDENRDEDSSTTYLWQVDGHTEQYVELCAGTEVITQAEDNSHPDPYFPIDEA